MGLGRLELPTSRLSGGRSNRAELQARALERSARAVPAGSIETDRSPKNEQRAATIREPVGRSPDRTSHREDPGFRPSRRSSELAVQTDFDLVPERREASRGLPRKEVIQPQVPLRLPCYDFTPITTQTLGASLPCGLGQRLLVQAAFVV